MIEELIAKIIALPNYGLVLKIKIFFIVLAAVFAALIVFFLLKTKWLKFLLLYDLEEVITFRPYGAKKGEKDWGKIIKHLDSGLESEYKLAVIEADNLLAEYLQGMGFGGATLEDKLSKLTSATLSDIPAARKSHDIRNKIVREPDFRLSKEDAKDALAAYEKALTDLQVL